MTRKDIPDRSLLSVGDCEQLREEGYIYLPLPFLVDTKRILKTFRAFVGRRLLDSEELRSKWTVALDDDLNDPDDGLIFKGDKSGEDSKWVFHHSKGLPKALSLRGIPWCTVDQQFLTECQGYFNTSAWLSYVIARDLDRAFMSELGGTFQFLKEWLQAQKKPARFSRDKLRLVDYIVKPGSVRRAQPHQDRSLFTLHFGQDGGSLYHCRDATGHDKVPLPSKPGYALLFFGVKAEHFTRGFCTALWHGADAAFGEERSIMTYFAHANYELQSTKG